MSWSMSMNSGDDKSRFQLADLLALCLEREGSHAELARQIARAYEAAGLPTVGVNYRIGRRTIRKIVACSNDFTLNLPQIRALHCYLQKHGCGLDVQTLFVSPTLLRSLAATGEVVFLLGSKPDVAPGPQKCRVNHSHLDVAAMTEILRGIMQHRGDLRVHCRDVLLQSSLADARASLQADWVRLLDDDGPSIVTIGLPRSNLATELVLARMFGVAPFQRASLSWPRLPFRVVFPRQIAGPVPSTFTLHGEDIAALDPDKARSIAEDGARGVVFDGQCHLAEPPDWVNGRTYGAAIGQVKRSGKIHLAVFGLNSIATFGGAMIVERVLGSLRRSEAGRDGPILWVPFEAHLQMDRPLAAWEVMERIKIEICAGGPRYWPAPKTGSSGVAATGGA